MWGTDDPRTGREQEFWDEHVPDLASCRAAYDRGPSPSVSAVLDAISPLPGKRVLDFACGAGILSARLAAHGADVTGVDVSSASRERARELIASLGLSARFTSGLDQLAAGSFDAVVGEYALHHVELDVVAPRLSELLRPGATGAFVETMARNPVLNVARRHLAGRGVVARWGSDDERPLGRQELDRLAAAFGSVQLQTREMQFLRLLDRNILRGRLAWASRALNRADDGLLRLGWGRLSYCQVVTVHRQ